MSGNFLVQHLSNHSGENRPPRFCPKFLFGLTVISRYTFQLVSEGGSQDPKDADGRLDKEGLAHARHHGIRCSRAKGGVTTAPGMEPGHSMLSARSRLEQEKQHVRSLPCGASHRRQQMIEADPLLGTHNRMAATPRERGAGRKGGQGKGAADMGTGDSVLGGGHAS